MAMGSKSSIEKKLKNFKSEKGRKLLFNAATA